MDEDSSSDFILSNSYHFGLETDSVRALVWGFKYFGGSAELEIPHRDVITVGSLFSSFKSVIFPVPMCMFEEGGKGGGKKGLRCPGSV